MMVSGAASVPHRIPSFQRFMEHVCAGRKIKGGISRRRASDKSRVTPLYLSKAEDLKFRVSRLILDRRRRAKHRFDSRDKILVRFAGGSDEALR
jgi:hypothetical protein